jgi:hypothetical protein
MYTLSGQIKTSIKAIKSLQIWQITKYYPNRKTQEYKNDGYPPLFFFLTNELELSAMLKSQVYAMKV